MRTLNLGILAHVDAGKTSLTERLLYAAGVIDEVGSVDDGNTQTDSMALERKRGITIKSAVVSFVVGDVTVNLIDTPGHPDFIAEVERVLNVLDGAVLVVSAVEGVQAQTRVLMRTLGRLRIPTLVFVNKIDRRGADAERTLRTIADRLTPAIVPMGSVRDLGTHAAAVIPYEPSDATFRTQTAELLADHDDGFLAAYVENEAAITDGQLRRELTVQTHLALVNPVFFGSAITGAGIDPLIAGIRELLPATDGEPDGPPSGVVFKVERGPAGEKVAYVRMFSGTVHVREHLQFGDGQEGKITGISVFDRGSAVEQASVAAGRIGTLRGLGDVQIGDPVGVIQPADDEHYFASPTLEAVVVPDRSADRAALHTALTQLAEQDPLINLRQDDVRQELRVSLYGEVQKEIIQATLAAEYGIDVSFRETTTICIERPVSAGASAEFMGDGNPFRATVGLRIEPALVGSGVRFELGIELGSLPSSFIKAVEETVHDTLRQGVYGWEVTDLVVTLTHSGYTPPPPYGWSKWSSSAGDFRHLTPLVLMTALRRAGTRVYEPMHRVRLEIPAETLGAVLPALRRLQATPHTPEMQGTSYVLDGVIPATRVHDLQQQLPGLTLGEGVVEAAFDHYQPVQGPIPTRPRTDHNPLDRKEYLLRVKRRI